MKLSKKALDSINKETALKLAIALNFSEAWINRLLKANKENGPLTTVSSMAIISRETGLHQDEILEADSKTTIMVD